MFKTFKKETVIIPAASNTPASPDLKKQNNEMNIQENQDEDKGSQDPFSGIDDFIMNKRIEPPYRNPQSARGDIGKDTEEQDASVQYPSVPAENKSKRVDANQEILDKAIDMQLDQFINEMDSLVQCTYNNPS